MSWRFVWGMTALALLALCPGCALVRYADYALPAVRLDRAGNEPLPNADAPAVQRAIDTWDSLGEGGREAFPTPYHVYVDTPAPGSFEGTHTVGMAFSGGGTRGILFCAAVAEQLRALGDLIVDAPDGPLRVNLFEELDYLSGVSTGAIPAALLALDYGGHCPPAFEIDQWPDCFNLDVCAYGLKRLAVRPDWLVRDWGVDMNTRAFVSGALAALYFEGKWFKPASGLTFGDLPRTPVLLLGAAVINDPGVPFMETRLPYRYCLDEKLGAPWAVGIQSFESFHSDPMAYPLGEACYNSISYPGHMRSGLMTVRADQPWVFDGLDGPVRRRMERARRQEGYAGTYEIKDGGLVDNRGVYVISRVLERLAEEQPPRRRPLLIGLDASRLALRAPEKGEKALKKGWFREIQASFNISWQTGQDAFQALMAARADAGAYAYVRFGFADWIPFLGEGEDSAEYRYLAELCRAEPLIGTPERLIEITRGLGTDFTDATEAEMAAVNVCARFAVWHTRNELLDWASVCHGGAPARFEHPLESGEGT